MEAGDHDPPLFVLRKIPAPSRPAKTVAGVTGSTKMLLTVVVPVPFRLAVSVVTVPEGLVAFRVRVALRLPVAAGRKATVTLHELPAATVLPAVQVPFCKKSPGLLPERAIPVTVMLSVVIGLVKVTVRAGLVLLAGWAPKSSEVAEREVARYWQQLPV
jgi:hypothetical protein